tara:strand:- start:7 stop:1116 length:1110 start_codon:yes stop_codon:yes gene_type:complete
MSFMNRDTMNQSASAARRGDRKALGDVLTAVTEQGGGFREYAGTPVSNVTPDRKGQFCLDSTNGTWWRAKGTANTDWVALGDPDISLAELTFLDGATAGFAVASKAVVLDSSEQYFFRTPGHIDSGRERIEIFDDFTMEAIQTTGAGDGLWIAFAGSDGDATAAAIVAGVPEGQILMGSGGAGSTNDGTVLSRILLAQGALVSLGMTVFECRVSFDQLTGTSWNFGLSDTLAESTERSLYTINSGTVADGGLTLTNAVCFGFSTDATATDKWQFCHENGGTIGNSGAEDAHTAGPTADTYQVLRIEVDATGDARFYIDGTLVKTETTAVATTSLLIPFIGGNSADDADVATDVHIDYIYFSHARPSSDA